MKNKLRFAAAAVLIILFGMFLPSVFKAEYTSMPVKHQEQGIWTEAEYTDSIGKNTFHDNYLRLESRKESLSFQRLEQRRNTYRLSIEIFIFLIFSLVIGQKRVYLSYRQFYSFPLARFLCEHNTLLEKDGKKRNLLS